MAEAFPGEDQGPITFGVTPTHLSLRIDGNDRLLHAIEQRGQLAATALERVEALLQSARRHVERVGNGGNLIQIALFYAGGQISRRDAIGENHNAGQATRSARKAAAAALPRSGEQRGQHDTAAQYTHRGRNVGLGVGTQSHHQGTCGNGNIESPPVAGATQGLMLVDYRIDFRGSADSIGALAGAGTSWRPWASKMPTSAVAAAASTPAIRCNPARS